jgi:hypothetical protein
MAMVGQTVIPHPKGEGLYEYVLKLGESSFILIQVEGRIRPGDEEEQAPSGEEWRRAHVRRHIREDFAPHLSDRKIKIVALTLGRQEDGLGLTARFQDL